MTVAGAPFRKVRLGPRETVVERRANGEIVLRSPHALGAYPGRITENADPLGARGARPHLHRAA